MTNLESYAVLARCVAAARNGAELAQGERLDAALAVAREALLGVKQGELGLDRPPLLPPRADG